MRPTPSDNTTQPAAAQEQRAALQAADILPAGAEGARLVGRVWSNEAGGPCPVFLNQGKLHDASRVASTVSELLERDDLIAQFDQCSHLPVLGDVQDFLDGTRGRLLAPIDLQAVKAAGVTFADSMLERVIEEQAHGDPAQAQEIRARLAPILGDNLRGLVAGSEQAEKVKALLQDMNCWSQYLEVGIGPDAEIFTKAQPMSSVGCGAKVGLHPKSEWNNPEPEVVLAIASDGRIVGATLGNDVNLRDFEGRSALLLSKAKDNNASCAIGPFIRLLDDAFTLERLGRLEVSLDVRGQDGFHMQGMSAMSAISRSPRELADQLLNRCHQYPDGAVLFLGTMFAPTKDRHGDGKGFTHEVGDRVQISAPELGALINWVDTSDACPEWTFGIRALMGNLAERGLLTRAS
jgi:fumarylacetoacetate (FAA) hydrolase family protein